MSRPRTPTALKVVKGTAEPRRINKAEPKPTGKPSACPGWLDAEQKKAYKEIIKDVPPSVLTSSDSKLVEIAAVLLAEFRTGKIQSARIGHLLKCLSQLGMTPADRSRINVLPEKEKNPWGDV